MSVQKILETCGLTAADVRRIAENNNGQSTASRNEARYNPEGREDRPGERLDDALREADATAVADYGTVFGSDWEPKSRISG